MRRGWIQRNKRDAVDDELAMKQTCNADKAWRLERDGCGGDSQRPLASKTSLGVKTCLAAGAARDKRQDLDATVSTSASSPLSCRRWESGRLLLNLPPPPPPPRAYFDEKMGLCCIHVCQRSVGVNLEAEKVDGRRILVLFAGPVRRQL